MSSNKKSKKKKQIRKTTRKVKNSTKQDLRQNPTSNSSSGEFLQKIHEIQKYISELEREKLSLRSEHEDTTIALAELENSLNKSQKIILSLKKEIVDLIQDLDTSESELEEYIELKTELTVKNQNITNELTDKQRLLETRNHQFEKLAQDYEVLYKKIVNDEKKNKTRKSSKKTFKKVAIESLNQLQEQVQIIEKLEKKIKSKDEEIDELINRLEIQEIKIEELEEEIENESKNRMRLEKAYNRIKGQI